MLLLPATRVMFTMILMLSCVELPLMSSLLIRFILLGYRTWFIRVLVRMMMRVFPLRCNRRELDLIPTCEWLMVIGLVTAVDLVRIRVLAMWCIFAIRMLFVAMCMWLRNGMLPMRSELVASLTLILTVGPMCMASLWARSTFPRLLSE